MFKKLSRFFKKDNEGAEIIITYDDQNYYTNPWWIKKTVKYSIIGIPGNLKREDVQKIFFQACQTWTSFISIKFKEVLENENPDINFRFRGKDDNDVIISSGAYEFIMDKDKNWVININGKEIDKSGDDLYSEVLTNIGIIMKYSSQNNKININYYKPVNVKDIYFQPYLSHEDIIAVQTLINRPYKIHSQKG